jgi:hypothetical protein
VSECHSEAQPKNLLFRNPLAKQMLRSPQHDIQVICSMATTVSMPNSL